MKYAIVSLFLAAVLLVPSLAAACSVTQIDGNADCDGWSACFSVRFTDPVMEIILEYAVVLVDGSGAGVEFFGEQVPVSRQQTGDVTLEFCFSGTWQDYHDNPPFQVAFAATTSDGTPIDQILDLNCIVPNEDHTWDQVKSFYR